MGVVVSGKGLTTYGPRIVTDGLITYLDGGNRKSYSGTGNDWYDIVGTTNGILSSGSTFQNNSFYFNASADSLIYCSGNTLFNTAQPFSIEFWSYLSSSYTGTYPVPLIIKTSQATGFVFFYAAGGYDGLNFGSNLNFTQMRVNTNSFFKGKWLQTVMTYDGIDRTSMSSYKLYLNTVEQTIVASSAYTAVPNSNIFGGEYHPEGAYFTGYISILKAYENKNLSVSEIQQNYNALKGRFGL